MAKQSSQKFIARNRAPRVQIEYDVELYGAEKKIQLPFVMGVMADLSGKSAEDLPAVADRKALDIDVDNFDERMKSMKPKVQFTVPNTLTGEGNLAVDITFESMDDFSPANVARKVDALNKLLEARTQLANLKTFMDGKTGAEKLIAKVLADPTLPCGCLVVNGMADCGMVSTPPAIEQALRQAVQDSEARLHRQFIKAQRAGQLAPDINVSDLAAFFTSLLAGLGILAKGGAKRAKLDAVIDAAMRAWPEFPVSKAGRRRPAKKAGTSPTRRSSGAARKGTAP